MKDKINQMLRDKMFLVILVLGLLTIVAAAGVFTIQRGNRQESSPYLEMPGPNVIAQEEQEPVQEGTQVAGASNADSAKDEEVEKLVVQRTQETWRRKQEPERKRPRRWC